MVLYSGVQTQCVEAICDDCKSKTNCKSQIKKLRFKCENYTKCSVCPNRDECELKKAFLQKNSYQDVPRVLKKIYLARFGIAECRNVERFLALLWLNYHIEDKWKQLKPEVCKTDEVKSLFCDMQEAVRDICWSEESEEGDLWRK